MDNLHLFNARPIWLFATTIFLSALLLFWVQLVMAKMLLPRLGGTPAVWTTCMLFFQVLLLAGYSYVVITTARLGVRKQVLLHGLGGLFNTLIAPTVFNALVEYPLVIVLACLIRPGEKSKEDSSVDRLLDVILPTCVGLVTIGLA